MANAERKFLLACSVVAMSLAVISVGAWAQTGPLPASPPAGVPVGAPAGVPASASADAPRVAGNFGSFGDGRGGDVGRTPGKTTTASNIPPSCRWSISPVRHCR